MTAQRTASRYRCLFEQLQDAVVEFELVDGEPVVRDVNPAFEEVFGFDAPAVVGESLNDVIVPEPLAGESATFDRQVARGERASAVVDRHTADGTRTFVYRGIPCEGGDRGFAVYTDVSDELRTEERLALLERVLRHNLRTEVNVISGRAEQVEEALGDDPLADAAGQIRDAAGRLTRLADEARQIERLLEQDGWCSASPLDVVESAVDATYLEERGASVDLDVDAWPSVRDGGSLQAAVEALLDNAARHSETDEPLVRVATRVSEDVVELRVVDDGPGIPEPERAVLEGECDQTPLEHGSGLGFWIVRYAVRACGGRIDVRERDPRGSVVELTLPRADD